MTNLQVTSGSYQDITRFIPQATTTTPVEYELLFVVGSVGGGASTRDTRVLRLEGTGFTYSGDQLTGGTVTRISFTNSTQRNDRFGGNSSFGGSQSYDGFSLDAVTFMSLFNANATVGMNALLLSGGVVFNGFSSSTLASGARDVFRASAVRDILVGQGGDDVLFAEGGDDYVAGGFGNDALLGGSGADLIFGEDGNDTVWGGDGNDIVLLGAGDDVAFGEGDDDAIYGEDGNDALFGGDGQDFVAGGTGNDYAAGDVGADYLYGEGGIDTLFGGAGDDTLVGGADGDALFGEDGIDALFGGTGNDYFVGGSGSDFLYVMYEGPTAGEQDFVDGFEAATSGTADWMVMPAAYQSATSFFDSAGYAWIATSVGGGTHYVAIAGASAATVQAQTIWV